MCLVMETGSIEEIAGLRRDRGVTVLSTRPARDEAEVQLIISGQISCMSRCHRNIDTVASKAQLRENLPQSDDASSSRVQLCYPRGLDIGSSLIHSIRSRLSSPSSGLQSPAPPTSRRWFYLVTMLLLLIALPCHVSASESNYAKVPLSRTDVTKSRDGFRIFRGLGPATYVADRSSHNGGDPVVLPRSARLLRTTIPPLDFQKMTFVEKWGGVLLVSGRNYIYMINASQPSTSGEIRYIERLQWASHPDTRSSCIDVGKQDYECNNFIRVVERLDNNTLYVCGTNSYEPKCRIYTRAQFAATTSSNTPFSREEMCHSQCGCPYDPATTSAVLYTNKTSSGSKMFSAAVTDFMGKRSYLVRSGSPSLKSVDKWLNDPSFVKLIEYGEKIYLFFRESPTNVETGSDHLTTWSRVAQVCKDDIGGATVLRYQWTSFLKARLTCSTQGSANRREVFHFNNLTSVSDITQIPGADGRLMDVVFATFTTPWEWSDISMSAICMYSIKHDIAQLFDEGHFMEEQQLRSSSDQYMTSPRQSGRSMPPPINTVIKKVPLPNVDEPATRPGSCNRGPVSNEAQYFAKAHQTMYESVEPRYGMPVFVTESNVRLTQLALDENAGSTDRLMLYAGTEDGKLLRIRPRLSSNQGPKSVLIEEMNVADQASCSSSASCAVRALHITHPDVPADISPELDANPQPSAFLAFTDRMAQVPLASCVHYANPGCCNFDPECGWMAGKCVSRNSHNPYPLPEITDAIPANCEKKPVVGGFQGDISTAGSSNFLVAGIIGFLLGVIFMVIIWCGFSHYQSRHRKHNISSTRGEYHVTPEHVKSHSTHTEGEDYFHLTAERGTPKHTSVGRPTSLGKGISGDDSQYAPLTPSSLEDKEFTTETEEKVVGHSTSPRTSNDSEITQPLLSATHETSLIVEIEQSFKSGSPLPGPPEPPSLPPKKSNLNKPPRPAQPAVLSSNNNSNNNKEELPPPPLCVLLAETPEKKTPDNLPNVTPVQMRHPITTPPTSNPPPPRPKMGLRKHQTFSGPHGQKIKPPVPPKSSSIGRAASMRVPPVRTSSLRTPTSPTPVTPTPTNPTLPPPPLLPQTKSTSPVRPQSRLPIHVEPPVVPSDKSFSST